MKQLVTKAGQLAASYNPLVGEAKADKTSCYWMKEKSPNQQVEPKIDLKSKINSIWSQEVHQDIRHIREYEWFIEVFSSKNIIHLIVFYWIEEISFL